MPSEERGEAVRRLQKGVVLMDIRPVGFFARLKGSAPGPGVNLQLELKKLLGYERDPEPDLDFRIRGQFGLSARVDDGAESHPPFVQIHYDLVAHYTLPEGEFDDGALDVFTQTNGMIHLWPYFRAYVSSALGQLGLIPFPVPVWRVHGQTGTGQGEHLAGDDRPKRPKARRGSGRSSPQRG